MTTAQVVRRKFKSALPRRIENRRLSNFEAMARIMDLFGTFREEMKAAGLDESDVFAGLVYCQPFTKGEEGVLARTVVLDPEHTENFVKKVMALDQPLFLGVMFLQLDHGAEKPEKRSTLFVWPFMAGPEAEKRLLAARKQQAKGGLKKLVN
jgi:hypothetical protein